MAQKSPTEAQTTQGLQAQLKDLLAQAAQFYASEDTADEQDPNYFTYIDDDLMDYFMLLFKMRRCPVERHDQQCQYSKKINIALDYRNGGGYYWANGCFDCHRTGKYYDIATRRSWTVDGNEPCFMAQTFLWTTEERSFHPAHYKKSLCQEFDESGRCNRGLLCTAYHTDKDKRKSTDSGKRKLQDSNLSFDSKPPQCFIDWMNILYRIRDIEKKIAKQNRPKFELFANID